MLHLRILLADDHTVVRQGLRKVLEERSDWEVIAESGDGRDAVRRAEELKPDVAIVDIGMPLLNGVEATRHAARGLGLLECLPPALGAHRRAAWRQTIVPR